MHAKRGFTLLEVMVALVVLGFLMIGLTQGLRFGLKAWTMQAGITAGDGDLDAVDRALRRLIEQMDPGSMRAQPLLAAGPERLTFRTELPLVATTLPTREVEAMLLVDSAHRLVLRWRQAAGLGPPPPVQTTELMHDVDHVAFSYLRPPAAGGGWVAVWDLRTLPVLVRIHIAFAPDGQRDWPDIIAAPILTPSR